MLSVTYLLSSNSLFSSSQRFPQKISSQTVILGTSSALIGLSSRGIPVFAKNSGCQDLALVPQEVVWRSLHEYFHFQEMSRSGGSLDPQDMEARQPTSPMAKLLLFSESVPPLCPGRTWVTLQIPSCPSASCPFTHHQSDKTPVWRRCGTHCSAILSEIKSNVAKVVFVGISKGLYWRELPSVSRVSVPEIFHAPMKMPASMLRFCFCIDCSLATGEVVWAVMFALAKMSLKERIFQIWGFGLIGSSWDVGLLVSQEQRKLPLGTNTKENPPWCGFSGIFEASDLGHCWSWMLDWRESGFLQFGCFSVSVNPGLRR